MNGRIVTGIRAAGQNMEIAKDTINQLDLLHSHVTQYMHIPDNRCIGHVLYADPIGVSSGSDGYTRDWAVVEIRKDAFADDFQGNTISIGTSPILLITTMLFILYHTGDKLEEQTFLDFMFPNAAGREDCGYPEHGLLCLRGVVPLNEILNPKQLDANGDPAMGVVKNRRTIGTTAGWISGLKFLVRH